MNKQTLSAALNHTFHISSRLLYGLLHHCNALFPNIVIFKYIPPLSSGAQLPDKPLLMEIELKKQESLLATIHEEMNIGCISREREELLWEVQRIITQLKVNQYWGILLVVLLVITFQRKLKIVQKVKDLPEKPEDFRESENRQTDNEETVDGIVANSNNVELAVSKSDISSVKSQSLKPQEDEVHQKLDQEGSSEDEQVIEKNDFLFDDDILLLTYKRNGLINLKEQLFRDMEAENREITYLKSKLDSSSNSNSITNVLPKQESLDNVMDLLQKENQILQIKKINLVREIIEEKELCIELSAQLKLSDIEKYSTDV